MKKLAVALYLLTIPCANWLINNVGTQYSPETPHTIPVGFGYNAPSGVLMIGFAFILRDYIQQEYGKRVTMVAIAIGVVISYLVNPQVAIASAVAFAVSELLDQAVFTNLKKQTLVGAVIASGFIGGIVDTVLFLQIAFGSMMFWQGQIIGKTIMAILGGIIVWSYRALSNRLFASQA
jgi:uncharacterized PurR-regulated membrane protein YhhQ (DUF165 family)